MIGVVVTGGLAPSVDTMRSWAANADLVVCADSGLDTAAVAGVEADIAVGDFDSIEGVERLKGGEPGEVIRFPRDKDETDTEIAVRIARERGADEVVVLGGGGGDMSHYVGILCMFDRAVAPDRWITDCTEFTCISDRVDIFGEVGSTVSFFPLGCEVCTMTSGGLRWSLDNITWRKGDIGVSNELASECAWVSMITGRLLMVRDMVRERA